MAPRDEYLSVSRPAAVGNVIHAYAQLALRDKCAPASKAAAFGPTAAGALHHGSQARCLLVFSA